MRKVTISATTSGVHISSQPFCRLNNNTLTEIGSFKNRFSASGTCLCGPLRVLGVLCGKTNTLTAKYAKKSRRSAKGNSTLIASSVTNCVKQKRVGCERLATILGTETEEYDPAFSHADFYQSSFSSDTLLAQ